MVLSGLSRSAAVRLHVQRTNHALQYQPGLLLVSLVVVILQPFCTACLDDLRAGTIEWPWQEREHVDVCSGLHGAACCMVSWISSFVSDCC